MNQTKRDDGYPIGVVASLTGLDPHTIRAWERRYGAVSPERTPGGSRRYGAGAVTRLQRLKALVDAGESIGNIAKLSDAALRSRLTDLAALASGARSDTGSTPLRIALLAPGLEAQLREAAASLGNVRIVSSGVGLDALATRLGAERPDLLVAELRALGREPSEALERIRHGRNPFLVLVVYDFAPAAELSRLSRAGARLVRGPLRIAELRAAIESLALHSKAQAPRRSSRPEASTPIRGRASHDGEIAPRRFDDVRLAALREVAGALHCECPNHLATLVTNLVAFERYSLDCENRDDADAALHRSLAIESSRIRATLESLLERVCKHEKLPY